jgi:antitoxin HicB
MNRDVTAYPITLRRLSAEEGGGYLAEFPDVPGAIGDGQTPEAAIASGREALAAALETLAEFGDPVPNPDNASAASGQWRQRVPKSLHARLVQRARLEGVSLNTLVTALIAEGLGARHRAPRRSKPKPLE